MNKNKIVALLAVLSGAACTNMPVREARPGDLALRFSAGTTLTDLEATSQTTFFGQTFTVKEKADAEVPTGRLEIGTTLKNGATAGGYFELGSATFGEADVSHLSLGGVYREFLGRGSLRPFAEVRAGLRHITADDISGLGAELGAALGLETAIGEKSTAHVQVGYDLAYGDAEGVGMHFEGISIMVGGSVRF